MDCMVSQHLSTVDEPDGLASRLEKIYSLLYTRYGPQRWWPGDGPLDVVIGAILTQSTSWTNVEMALANLKDAGCWSLHAIHLKPQDELASIIRPSGYFNAKARKLKAFAEHVEFKYGGDLDLFLSNAMGPLREELLSIYGVGPETADDIVLYGAEKPTFVIDSYTRRIVGRLGIAPDDMPDTYEAYRHLFLSNLPPYATMFNEYHALLDRHAKETCAKIPRCKGCCLMQICTTGRLTGPF